MRYINSHYITDGTAAIRNSAVYQPVLKTALNNA